MKMLKLKVNARASRGSADARRTRRSGVVPGVLYGGDQGPAAMTIELREFIHLMHSGTGEHAIVELESDTAELSGPALLKKVQHHPVRDTVIHADFQRIRLDESIKTSVPLVLTGHCKGIVDGGVLDHQLRELEVECKPLEVPDTITVDITDLEIGGRVHVSDIAAPENVIILTDPARAVATIHQPRVLKSAAEEAAEAVAVEEAQSSGES